MTIEEVESWIGEYPSVGIGQWLFNKAADTQMAEAHRYLEVLKGAGQGEIDLFASAVMFWRAFYLTRRGIDLDDVISISSSEPAFCMNLLSSIKQLQKSGAQSSSAGLMLWLHTARSARQPELRYTAKRMWEQLERCGPSGYALAEEMCLAQNLGFSRGLLIRPEGLED